MAGHADARGAAGQPGRRDRHVGGAGAGRRPSSTWAAAEVTRIGIFLNLFDVHVTRAPIGGRVAALRYTKGRFINASRDKASQHNERMAIRLAPPEGPEIACVQVAGLVARRIVCDLREGQRIAAGQRIGIIRFGSRVDVYCPPPYVTMVVAGQRMVGGETVLADRLARGAAAAGHRALRRRAAVRGAAAGEDAVGRGCGGRGGSGLPTCRSTAWCRTS